MTKRFRCESIICDLDGTLWSPLLLSVEAWRQSCIKHHFDPDLIKIERVASVYGMVFEEATEIMLPTLPPEVRMKILVDAGCIENSLIEKRLGTLFAGVPETLELLSRTKRLFLCSNCQSGYIDAFFRTYDVSRFFTATIASGDTGEYKTDNLKTLIKRYEISEAVFVGDTESDHHAARTNKIPFIYASYGFGNLTDFDASIATFGELPNLLDRTLG